VLVAKERRHQEGDPLLSGLNRLSGSFKALRRALPYNLRLSMVPRCTALTVALLLLVFSLAPALAQSDSGEIDIVVVDATTKQPLELARVLLDGPVITSEITEHNGKVTFTDVPNGIYRARIVKRGYSSLTSAKLPPR